MSTEISFEAALRDVKSGNARARNIAVRNLAQGLLDNLGRSSPSWKAAGEHPQGETVLAALRDALEGEGDPNAQGLALVGLAQLGEPEVLDLAKTWLDADAPDHLSGKKAEAYTAGMVFLRECAVIGLGLLGRAAPDEGPDVPEGRRVHKRCDIALRAALTSEHDDVRFQSAMSLAELGGDEAQEAIVAALGQEREAKVMQNQIAALNTFEAPSRESLEARALLLEGEDAQSEAGLRAALGLTAARDLRGNSRLLSALARPPERDRALEGLAALGEDAPAAARPIARKLAQAWLTPQVTRVRAAYALARMTPEEGRAVLARMSRSVRPSVRVAVREAQAALQVLAARDATPSDEPAT